MFVPRLYRAAAPQHVADVILRYPLALLISNGPEVPYATQLPVVPRQDAECEGDLVGSTLWGHLNRANPHWTALTGPAAAKLVFSGPGTYVSPAAYQNDPAAPTWDFITVHLSGELRPIAGGETTLAVVRRTAELLERRFGDGWDCTLSVGYFRSIARGVGAFEFRVQATESMFKLSQEKPVDVRRSLIDRFATACEGSAGAEVAAWMTDLRLGDER